MDRPEANSRCVWLSVVRAPMAPQLIRSAMNWGVMVSKNSEPAGVPAAARSNNSWRARRRPELMSKLLSRRGSLIMPFQPVRVRGFSK